MDELTSQFRVQPSSGVPIYRQLMDQVRNLIRSKRWPVGMMLPSVRQMAVDLEINAMTVSKAYSRLEIEGLVERVRGTGMRVSATHFCSPVAERKEQLRPVAEALVAQGQQLGLNANQIAAVVKQELNKISGKSELMLGPNTPTTAPATTPSPRPRKGSSVNV
jgi:GntR family transcriptional regulator